MIVDVGHAFVIADAVFVVSFARIHVDFLWSAEWGVLKGELL